jgi:DNA-binding NarL/FixJ family response regulator
METTIVVADDHALVREGIRRLLETRPDLRVVGEASDGEEAIRVVLEKRPDLAILDLNMPGRSGLEAARLLHQSGSGTRVLVLSMLDDRSHVEEALRAGAAGYVAKSAPPEDLFAAVDAVRAGGSYLSGGVRQRMTEVLAGEAAPAPDGLSLLTEREREVLALIAEGRSSREIAAGLGVSLKTVDSHRTNLMEKLDIHKVAGLVRFAIRSGLVAA